MVSGSVSDAEARDLAGEAFSVPWVTAIVITILGNPFAQWTLRPLHRQSLWALLGPHASRPVPPVFRRPPGEVEGRRASAHLSESEVDEEEGEEEEMVYRCLVLGFLRQRAPSCPLLLQETVNAVER